MHIAAVTSESISKVRTFSSSAFYYMSAGVIDSCTKIIKFVWRGVWFKVQQYEMKRSLALKFLYCVKHFSS